MDVPLDKHNNSDKYKQFSIYLTEAFLFMNQYGWIPNSYVAEFFAQDHWEKLPISWRRCLENASLAEVATNILKYSENKKYNAVWPLSLLSFVATSHALSLNREQIKLYENDEPPELTNIFRKHIKPKKRHELSILPEVIHDVCERTGTRYIVDVGSGLGHLARFLAYKYGYDVTAIEMTSQSLPVAEKFDKQMERELQHILKDNNSKHLGKVRHINKKIEADISSEEFCTLIDNSGSGNSKCLLIGLHTCGDLASTMLKVFKSTPSISAIVSVSCCYFRMSLKEDPMDYSASCTELSVQPTHNAKFDLQLLYNNFSLSSLYTLIDNISDLEVPNGKTIIKGNKLDLLNEDVVHFHVDNYSAGYGFPLSHFLKTIPCQPLKYKSFETACHFIDDYSEKLLNNSPNIKLHCYRAVMEVLLRKIDPKLVLAAVRCKKIKNAASMTFSEYAEKVIERVKKDFDYTMLDLIDCEDLLSQWQCVCIYHSLALLLGPVIESIALVDKCMFLLESDFNFLLSPLFDPKISPRNFVVVGSRKNYDEEESR